MKDDSFIIQARRVWENTDDVTTKVMLSQFSRQCPSCGKGYNAWKLLPPIQVINDKVHLVKYKCNCGEVFKKMEDPRE
ncbi:hypothetical protein [Sporohalobacter salinus]|uniref:hypothetical protein n=1 Tax=Sporohalobacter salinus TaxID=1494606 RepID=UPI00195F5307|nr:hypothetical protein [Sporohalobacter salinus]MBM7623744.1 hypothetical protein [Sporohalobacter salinus]